jgi:hypothetical protein
VLLLAAAVALLRHARYDVAGDPVAWDARYYLYFSWRVAEGDVPYRDFFDNKTPLSYLLGGVAFRVADAAGLDGVVAARVLSLGAAAAAALLAFALQRRLAGGRQGPAALALLALLGLTLLAWLPAIGTLPKLLMAACASATALLVGRRRFVAAGVAGGLAFLDWQIGALAVLGALAGAGLSRRPWRAAGRVAAGTALALLPVAGWLAARGALPDAWRQTVATMLVRGEGPWWTRRSMPERLARIADDVSVACPGREAWIVPLAVLGLGLFLARLWRRRRHPLAPTLACLAVYHAGVAAFSLRDYQSYGDLFILLHSLAFFAGDLLATLARLAAAGARRRGAGRGRLAAAAACFVLAVPLLPSTLRTELDLRPPTVARGVTLAEQRALAREAAGRVGDARVAAVGPAEALLFAGRASALPFVYWNSATYHHYRRDAAEGYVQSLTRLARRAGVEVLIGDATLLREAGDEVVASPRGGYALVLRRVRSAR